MSKYLAASMILVARPDVGGQDLCAAIESAGGKAIHFPTIAFAPPRDEQLFEQMVHAMGDHDWIIFNSPQAVRATVVAMRRMWPHFADTVKLAAVGAGTARALKEAGYIVNIIPEQEWSSEGLLALPEFADVAGQKIMIVRGEGGRELLEKVLQERRARVSSCVAYQRVLPHVSDEICTNLFKTNQINAVVAGSFATVSNLKLLLGKNDWPQLFSIPLIVMSDRVKELAAREGFQTIWVAATASNQAVLDLLMQRKEELCPTSKKQ